MLQLLHDILFRQAHTPHLLLEQEPIIGKLMDIECKGQLLPGLHVLKDHLTCEIGLLYQNWHSLRKHMILLLYLFTEF